MNRIPIGWDLNQHLQIRDYGPQPEKGGMFSPGREWDPYLSNQIKSNFIYMALFIH